MRLPFAVRRFASGPGRGLLVASLCGWALMLVAHGAVARTIALCSGAEVAWPLPGAPDAGSGPAAVAWLAMILAMAPLLLRAEIGLLWSGTLRRRRGAAVAAFVVGYAAPWLALGLAALAAPDPTPAALAAGAALGLAWQCAPLRQRCLNACHARPSLRAFGPAMLADAARWGGRTGALCAATCGPAMLIATSLPPALHLPAMAGAVLLGAAERRSPPRPAAWRPPVAGGRPLPWEARTLSIPPGA